MRNISRENQDIRNVILLEDRENEVFLYGVAVREGRVRYTCDPKNAKRFKSYEEALEFVEEYGDKTPYAFYPTSKTLILDDF